VFVAYSSIKGTAFIDRALYLPEEEWANDPKRRAEASVPEKVAFASKIESAKEMLQMAFEAGVAARWVLADSFYGRSQEFREWLEKRGQAYAVMVPKSNTVDLGGRKKKIEHLAQQLPEDAWWEVLPVEDSSERRPWQWACLELAADPQQETMSRWLLVRRDSEDPDGDLDFYQAYGPEDTSVEELLRVCQERWAIEFAFEEAKGEIGMDHYEVRKWGAWHRYITLCLLAHAFLVVTRLAARNKEVACKKEVLSLA
jgi:SRSO17 transposase